ncbi:MULTISPECIES: aspartate dehydrogenase [unclassified Rhizobium]|uniref:aspartate dehydrogenase n=1 Tax=unclassified Rhizobium TaxID=2613769 RepID=UPI000EA8A7A4|nr:MULTISPECIES: aspartate dehydrogenase [unclassified Rhizobium]AYG71021.1 aspartate dehydrogenase [Rhizobium sp. CCGE531]AYG77332.1 aspartate dehydrogenase [Rhizobium sp. CCGE532]
MKVGIAGIGAVGAAVARALDRGEIPGCELAAVTARDNNRAAQFVSTLARSVPHRGLDELAFECDIVLEALPPAMFEAVARPALEAGKTLIAMSASQLLGRTDLFELAKRTGGRVIVPSGAMLGLDALKAAAVGNLRAVSIVTRKPPASLHGAPYIARQGINLASLKEPICILKGSVTEVAREFPANVNVAAAVSLAGIGPDRTLMEIWADPSLSVNSHAVSVQSDSSDFTVSIQNRPSDENPATGRITSQSVIAYLRQLNAVIRIGT